MEISIFIYPQIYLICSVEYFVGIDPSINSTGICVRKYDGDTFVKEDFVILTPERKLTKKEQTANDSIDNFGYVFYSSMDLKVYDGMNHYGEYWKSWNMICCAKAIKEVIKEFTKDSPEKISIVIEGISYGSSIRTRSIFDLAGLNYLIREKFIEKENIVFTVATPSEIKKFATGNGNCNKEAIVMLFSDSHPQLAVIPKVDDISDAWFMSNYAKIILEKENG